MEETSKLLTKKYKIEAEIVDRESGNVHYDDIRMIRLISKDHNLLIMEDYMPVIGEVTGSVELVMDEDVVTISPVHGFYMHKKNKFSLLVENHDGTVPVPVK